MTNVRYNSFNQVFFYDMQKEELENCIVIIKRMIEEYKPSKSGVCISDQEHQRELKEALVNAKFLFQNPTWVNLNKFK